MLCVDTLHGLVIIFLVEFKPDVVPFLLDASDGRCARPHKGIEHSTALVAAEHDKFLYQRDGLLRQVNLVVAFDGLNLLHTIVEFVDVESIEGDTVVVDTDDIKFCEKRFLLMILSGFSHTRMENIKPLFSAHIA